MELCCSTCRIVWLKDDARGEKVMLFVLLLLLLSCIVLRRHMGFACYGCAVHDGALGGREVWVGRQSVWDG